LTERKVLIDSSGGGRQQDHGMESRVSTGKPFCHSRESGNENFISREFPGIYFYSIKLKKCSFLKTKIQYWLTLYGAPRLLTKGGVHIIVDF
jgi:hypothetical protein